MFIYLVFFFCHPLRTPHDISIDALRAIAPGVIYILRAHPFADHRTEDNGYELIYAASCCARKCTYTPPYCYCALGNHLCVYAYTGSTVVTNRFRSVVDG